jgi:two-component system nitrogen regulation sensor histidine kinase NtrY
VLPDKDLNVVDEAETKVTQAFVKPSAEVLAGINDTEPQVAMFSTPITSPRSSSCAVTTTSICISRFSTRGAGALRGRGQRRAVRRPLGAAHRDPDRVRVDVHGDCTDVLLSAVWIGLNFANYLVAPI